MSGWHYLFTFNFNISFRTISSVIFILGRFTLVILSRTGTSAFGSLVKTLKKCFWRIFALSLLSNFVEVSFHPFHPVERCHAGFGFKLTTNMRPEYFRDQNILGLLFNWVAICLSNSLFDLRIIALTLFLALVYACGAFSGSETFKTFFDGIRRLCSFLWRVSINYVSLISSLCPRKPVYVPEVKIFYRAFAIIFLSR